MTTPIWRWIDDRSKISRWIRHFAKHDCIFGKRYSLVVDQYKNFIVPYYFCGRYSSTETVISFLA